MKVFYLAYHSSLLSHLLSQVNIKRIAEKADKVSLTHSEFFEQDLSQNFFKLENITEGSKRLLRDLNIAKKYLKGYTHSGASFSLFLK